MGIFRIISVISNAQRPIMPYTTLCIHIQPTSRSLIANRLHIPLPYVFALQARHMKCCALKYIIVKWYAGNIVWSSVQCVQYTQVDIRVVCNENGQLKHTHTIHTMRTRYSSGRSGAQKSTCRVPCAMSTAAASIVWCGVRYGLVPFQNVGGVSARLAENSYTITI